MSSHAVPHKMGWADLPGDVLLQVARGAEELPPKGRAGAWRYEPAPNPPLLLQDVLSAAAACGAWRRALASPDLECLTIGGATPGKRAWMQRARPGARCLHVYASAASQEGQALLRCVRGEAVQEAEVARVPACLPDPSQLPNLRSLTVSCLEWDEAWLAALAQLPLLAHLEITLAAPARQPAGQPASQAWVLPALPALERLHACIEPGCPPLRLELGRLPGLQELELWGSAREEEEDRGAAEVVGPAEPGGPPSRLDRISLDLSRATLDCRGMPALRRASLWARELAGAGTLGSAAGLHRLRLGSDAAGGWARTFECALDKPWLVEALGALPAGLGVLELRGTFLSPQVAAAVSGLRGVPVLSLSLNLEEDMGEELEEGSLGPGPLWAGLRALRWASWQPLPPALAAADQLEVLDWVGADAAEVPQDIQTLAGLRRLRRLLLAICGRPPAELEGQLRAALPGLRELVVGSMAQDCSMDAFLRAACGAGAGGGA